MKLITKNKIAYFDYDIQETLEAGIILAGHEVKAIKAGQCNIRDAIIRAKDGLIDIVNMDIPLYKKANLAQLGQYEAKKRRRLLIHKKQLTKRTIKTNKTGLGIIPLQIYLDKNHRIKVLIGLVKRRRKVEKKQILKERDQSKQMQKQIKNLGL